MALGAVTIVFVHMTCEKGRKLAKPKSPRFAAETLKSPGT